MQLKGTIRLFAIVFTLVSLYSLSFTYCTRQVEKDARNYANSEAAHQLAKQMSNGNTNIESVLFDSISDAWESRYLDSMSNEGIYNLLVKNFTYRDCKERELNLGLDLRGGMNVTLEISEADIIIALAEKRPDPVFKKAIENAKKSQENSQENFVTLFVKAVNELDPNRDLYTFFDQNPDLKDKITLSSTDDEVIKFLDDEMTAARERTFLVLRKRIDKFGVTQPNIQQIGNTGRIQIELPGVKDPTRVRKILQGTAKLEFWETHNFAKIAPLIEKADKVVYDKLTKAETIKKDTAVADSSKTLPIADAKAATAKPAQTKPAADVKPVQTKPAIATSNKAVPARPLASLISFNFFEGSNYPADGPIVGSVHIKDTAAVNDYLRIAVEEGVFSGIKVKFAWGAKPEEDENKVSTDRFQLYALNIDTKEDGKADLEGDKVTDAMQDVDQNGKIEVTMSMNSEGAKIWKDMTRRNIGKAIAIVLDNVVYSAPNVQTEIPNGRSSISGTFTVQEGQDLANVLKSGKLPAPARIVEEAVVGPSLGTESINAGMLSFLISFLLVLAYMIFFYNKAGIAANIALAVNVLFIFGALASMGAVLTLPGIAGIVLSIGMAVDANVLIYERVKEELRAGKGLRLAIDDGYKNALSAIVDGNVTTLLIGFILLWFGSGPVQGFATTLIIGIFTTLFTALFISRLVFMRWLDRGKNISFSIKITENFLANTKFDFIKTAKFAYFFSGLIFIAGIISLTTRGDDAMSWGVDFTGGRTYTVRFDNDVKVDDVRSALFKSMGETPDVKTFGSNNQIKITTKYMINDDKADSLVALKVYESVKGFYTTPMSVKDFTSDSKTKVLGILSSQKVGPTIADDIKTSSLYALIIALIVIFVYVAIRFKNWQFGLGGILALFHDVMFTIFMFSWFHGILPFTLDVDQTFIAALLTIIGYSINDTVVIFDRIREYRTLYPTRDMKWTINGALNSTLGRTINTAGSVFIVLIAIFILGGEVIRGFSFAMLIGCISGTYSTLYIATPVAYELIKRKKKKA